MLKNTPRISPFQSTQFLVHSRSWTASLPLKNGWERKTTYDPSYWVLGKLFRGKLAVKLQEGREFSEPPTLKLWVSFTGIGCPELHFHPLGVQLRILLVLQHILQNPKNHWRMLEVSRWRRIGAFFCWGREKCMKPHVDDDSMMKITFAKKKGGKHLQNNQKKKSC